MSKSKDKYYGADAIVDSLINHNVKYVIGIPGAKIDLLFERLEHSDKEKTPKLIVARHEQNAAFIAAGIGRLTGEAGVVAATSGPGASNLVTGLVTATVEGDPVLAIGGQVQRKDLLRLTHQSMRNAELFHPITKFSAEIQDPDNISEVMANGFIEANSGKQGASFISIPQDVNEGEVNVPSLTSVGAPILGPASTIEIGILAAEIKKAKMPVILAGMRASSPEVTNEIRNLVKEVNIPVVETFQAAGIISRELEENHFFGRVGLFRNQPGDKLLKQADLVITVGYDAVEYEPRNWNAEKEGKIIAIDNTPAQLDIHFQPETQLVGDIAQTIGILRPAIKDYELKEGSEEILKSLRKELTQRDQDYLLNVDSDLVEPLAIISELQELVTDQMTVSVDVGSHYIWMARHFKSYEPRHLLFSNGMQTLGVALPWAISAALVRPESKSISVSGDGGFLFSAQELETAVRLNLDIVHIIWNDGYYDMVKFQEEIKYGNSAGVKLGSVDFVKYAESFGATGLRVNKPSELKEVLQKAFDCKGPVVVDIPVDYSHNKELGKTLLLDQF